MAVTGKTRAQVCEQYTGYVKSIAGKYKNKSDLEDLVQEGFIGLLEAYDRFDPSKGNKFITYATFYIRKHIYQYLRQDDKYVASEDTDLLYHSPETISDAKAELEDNAQLNLAKSKVTDFLLKQSVSDRDKTIILDRMFPEYKKNTLQDIADRYKLSRQRVKQICDQYREEILEIIKQEVNDAKNL